MKDKLIVALDVDSLNKAKKLINELSAEVNIFKVGSELFTACGPEITRYLRKKKKKIFLDLKFHDIPNTVKRAVLAASRMNVFMLNAHASGGLDMMKEAKKAARGKTKIIAVTVLTSKKDKNAGQNVLRLAKLAKKAGLDGVVSSPRETKAIKKALGKNFIVVNPGIRPVWAARGDQIRISTPKEAIKSGADFIVVGRPITKAKNPLLSARKILEEIK